MKNLHSYKFVQSEMYRKEQEKDLFKDIDDESAQQLKDLEEVLSRRDKSLNDKIIIKPRSIPKDDKDYKQRLFRTFTDK